MKLFFIITLSTNLFIVNYFAQVKIEIVGCSDYDSAIYSSIYKTKKLVILIIGECSEITYLPPLIEKVKLKELKFYWVGLGNEIINYDKIGAIKTLASLTLGPYCNLEFLPVSFRKLTNLEVLDVSLSSLKLLPDWISELQNLNYINISKTNIKELPINQMKKLKKLKVLNISDTPLSQNKELVQFYEKEIGIKIII